MNRSNINPPVGLTPLKRELVNNRRNKKAYETGVLAPPHFFLEMEDGDGFTTALEFITEVFIKHRFKQFNNILPFVESKLDDAATNLEQMMEKVNDCSVYTNQYDGVVGTNPLQMAYHEGEETYDEFFKFLQKTAEAATFVFFVPRRRRTQREDKLLEKITEILSPENVRFIQMEAYTPKEKELIIMKYLRNEVGIHVEPTVEERLQMFLIDRDDIKTAKDCVRFAKKNLIPYICFDKMPATLTGKKVCKLLDAEEKAVIL